MAQAVVILIGINTLSSVSQVHCGGSCEFFSLGVSNFLRVTWMYQLKTLFYQKYLKKIIISSRCTTRSFGAPDSLRKFLNVIFVFTDPKFLRETILIAICKEIVNFFGEGVQPGHPLLQIAQRTILNAISEKIVNISGGLQPGPWLQITWGSFLTSYSCSATTKTP